MEGGVIAAERCRARREVARAGERWRVQGGGGASREEVQGAEAGRWFGAMGLRVVVQGSRSERRFEEVGLSDGAELWE